MKNEREGSPIRAVIYARISDDKTGEGLGVERQLKDCRALAERLGWQVVGVYCDNDISAYSGKPRPKYRAMLESVKAGHVDAIVAWAPDRLYRRMVDLLEFTNLAETHSLLIETVNGGKVDLTTPQGRFNANVLGAAAQMEVENTRARVRSSKEQKAEAGEYRGGRRPYGYEKDGMTIREDEAAFIRSATRDVLAGRSLAQIADEANAKGLQAVRVRRIKGEPKDSEKRETVKVPWTYNSVRRLLLRPRNAGLVASGHPEERADYDVDKAIIAKAKWPEIVSEEEWRALVEMFGSRRTGQNNAARWLGSRIFTCGRPAPTPEDPEAVCGQLLDRTGGPKRADGSTLDRYTCREMHLGIDAVVADEVVRQEMARLLRDERLVAALTAHEVDETQADKDRRRVLVAQLAQTERDYDADLIDARRYKAKSDRIKKEMTEIDTRLAHAAMHAATHPALSALDPGAAFLNAPVDVQRALLRQVLRVRIEPAEVRGRNSREQAAARVKVAPVVVPVPAV